MLLAAVLVVAGGSGSKATGARGASPADGLPAVASSRRSRRVFLAALFKASQRRGSGGPWIRGDRFRRWLAMLGGGRVGFTEVLGVWL